MSINPWQIYWDVYGIVCYECGCQLSADTGNLMARGINGASISLTALCKNQQMCRERIRRMGGDPDRSGTMSFTPGIVAATQERNTPPMSEARWCDYRDHPYKGGREGTIMVGRTTRQTKNGGEAYTEDGVKEICPECAAEMGLNPDYVAPETPAERHTAIETGKKVR